SKQLTNSYAKNVDLIKQAKINTANKVQINNTKQIKETRLNLDKEALAGAINVNLTNKENTVSAITPTKIANKVQATEKVIDLKDLTPDFNITNEATRYNLGVNVQQGQIIYAQIYIKNQNKFITWTTDKNDPGKNLYYYTTTGTNHGGQVVPNNATTTLSATLNNSGNNMKGTIDTTSAGTIANSQYKGGKYNFSLSSTKGAYYQTIVSGANSDSPVSNGDSGSVSWGGNSPIVWKFRACFGDTPMPNQEAPTWKSAASIIPNNVSQKIYYINADTGAILGEKESEAALAGSYYDIKNADPETISVNGQNYQLVAANTVSDDIKRKQVSTVDGTPILISDLIDGQGHDQGQLSMYNKGDILMTLLSAGPDFKLFVRKMLDNLGTAEYNTYTVNRSETTAGAFDVSLDSSLSRASVKKDEVFSGSSIHEQNISTDGNSGLVFFYKPEDLTTTGKVTYYDETDKKVLSTHDLTGNVGDKIDYTTTDTITSYENQGYKFVNSDFKNGDETYQKDPSANDFTVNFVHDTQTVTPDKPGEPGQPINPNDPNGPKWPDDTGKDALEKPGSQTIHYEGAGENTPKDNVEKTNFTKTATVDKVTGKVISSTDWTPSEHTFGTVKTPVVEGYHADKAEAGGFKATPDNPDTTIVVTYAPNGKIIPVDKDGNPIPDAPTPQFPTNPDNPTTTTDGKIPSVPGYTPENGQAGDPVKPGKTPSDNVDVPYVKTPTVVATTGKVTYYDETDKKVLSTHDLAGNVGDKIDYTTTDTITSYENQGYKFVNSDFKNGDETYQKDPSANDFTVNFVHDTQTVTPDKPGEPGQPINPNDPNGPKWPDDTGKDALEKPGSQTIHYEGAGENTPKDNVEKTNFTKTATVDKVTGKVISSTDWTPSEHTFGTVKTPVVEGYHADKAEAGGFKATPDNPDTTIVVTYAPNGKIIPVDKDGNPIPDAPTPQFPTNPDNPTTTTDGKIPSVPGYTPENGQAGDPVKPGKTPSDNVDVPYVKTPTVVATTGKVTYYDETDKKVLSTHDLAGNVGDKIDYTTTDTITSYENQGYQFVDSTFKNGDETYQKDPTANDF
ncbi:MAG: hypothetical protein K2O64_04560, partial [Lactobacillus sp.]|nr:hypothetical protein [Lactobacillus sp.]